MSCICVLVIIHLCGHTTSVVLLYFLHAHCDWARYLLILSSVLLMKILEKIFLITSARVLGRRFFTNYWVFFGSGSSSNIPAPSFTSSLLLSNILYSILLISWWTSSGAYLISSILMLFFLGAFLLAIFLHYFCHFFGCCHFIQPLGWGYEIFCSICVVFFVVIFEMFLYYLLNFLWL